METQVLRLAREEAMCRAHNAQRTLEYLRTLWTCGDYRLSYNFRGNFDESVESLLIDRRLALRFGRGLRVGLRGSGVGDPQGGELRLVLPYILQPLLLVLYSLNTSLSSDCSGGAISRALNVLAPPPHREQSALLLYEDST